MSQHSSNSIQNGWVRTLQLNPPSLDDNTADIDRLIAALKKTLQINHIRVNLALMKDLPGFIRRTDYHLHCVVFKDGPHWQLVNILPGHQPCHATGVAIDLGTSRVALRLVDLLTGTRLGERVFDNPQMSIGSDILTRIHYASNQNDRDYLQQLIIDELNIQIEAMCRRTKRKSTDVYLVTLAGNTTMAHLFLGMDPYFIIREPYIPVTNRPGVQPAVNVGLALHANAQVMVFPNIGSYFGGDLMSGILVSGLNDSFETGILVDVGTNAEVVLGNREWLIACAGAAGPALEGSVSDMGMMAGPGAIDHVHIDHDTGQWHLRTIADQPARGICGSGMIDLAAQLYLAGLLDLRGKFVTKEDPDRFETSEGMNHLIVATAEESATGRPLTISQADIDSLIRSKAAMYTILETITNHVGLGFDDLSIFHVAGTFGAFIDPKAAVTIGMIPDLPLTTYNSLGNSSLEGATRALLSVNAVDTIDRIQQRITYLELNVNQAFMSRFSAAKFIPHTDKTKFPSVSAKNNN